MEHQPVVPEGPGELRRGWKLLADEAILGREHVVRERLLVEDVAELAIERRPLVVAHFQQSVLDPERVVDVLSKIMMREFDHPVVEVAAVEELQPLLLVGIVPLGDGAGDGQR